jgi:predicted DNA-binding protein
MKKPKMGRPPLPAHKRRDDKLEIRLNVEERKRVEALCKETGLDLSALIRLVVLGMTDSEIQKIAAGKYAITSNGRVLWT